MPVDDALQPKEKASHEVSSAPTIVEGSSGRQGEKRNWPRLLTARSQASGSETSIILVYYLIGYKLRLPSSKAANDEQNQVCENL
uniref:Uncharacterized protein n=1 Tax=Leersia perrieri TaxID=77586 RepID=A0A0D9WEQ8_9ORYZ